MSLLRWTSQSTRTIAEELTRLGHPVTWVTVARCLDDLGYSLQANRKTQEGPQQAHRDAPFRYIYRQVKRMLKAGDPVISVDAEKKELVGRFKNAAARGGPRGSPRRSIAKISPSPSSFTPMGTYIARFWTCPASRIFTCSASRYLQGAALPRLDRFDHRIGAVGGQRHRIVRSGKQHSWIVRPRTSGMDGRPHSLPHSELSR